MSARYASSAIGQPRGKLAEWSLMRMLLLEAATAAQLDVSAEANLVTHMSWLQERTAGMRVVADDQLVMIDSGLPTDNYNVVCRARLNDHALHERIAGVVTHFKTAQRPFSWWVGSADRPVDLSTALLDAGLVAAESEVAMAADLGALHMTDLRPQGLRIERATTAKQVHEFATILATTGTPTEQAVLRFYEAVAPGILAVDAPIWLYVGYLGTKPVATAELTVGEDIVGLYNISTAVAHRRLGIGSALTLRPLLDARALGFRTAILQAAAPGLGVYSRLGFRATGGFTEYKVPTG